MPFNSPIPKRKPDEQDSGGVQSYVQTEKVVQIAIVLPVAVLIGWLGGAWLANHFHQPWMTLVGFILGSVAGISAAIRMAIAFGGGPDKGGNGAGKPGSEDRS
jgi:F0F1-type ATP synthase assembly protein I